MAIIPTPGESAINASLRAFLIAVLPADFEVIAGQDNRVGEPRSPNFAVFTPTSRGRLATNVDGSDDCKFTGSIAGAVMTVSAVAFGTIKVDRTLFGVEVLPETVILNQLSGPAGEAGTYSLSKAQVLPSRTLAAGGKTVMQETRLTIQVDVFGPRAADSAQVISTLMRDSFATEFFDALGLGVSPLHADDPKQVVFVSGEQQYEDRWVLEALLQADIVVTVPQQYADSAIVPVESVDVAFPP